MYQIKEVSEISGVSVRTLHYYDEIGLLIPSKKEDNGYRVYCDEDINRLQIILSYKYLGFSLKEIQQLIQEETPSIQILESQLVALHQEQENLLTIINTLEQTIQVYKGEYQMEQKDKFKGLSFKDNQAYREEATQKYGKEVIDAAYEKANGHEEEMATAMNQAFQQLALNNENNIEITDNLTQDAVQKLYDTINQYSFDCSLEVFGQIGCGYVADPRFTKNIDQFGTGTAQYTCDAIQYFIQK